MNVDSKNSIRFASINIEGDTNLQRVLSFLRDFKPDVVCFQELVASSVRFFEDELGMKGHFLPMSKYNIRPTDMTSPIGAWGVGIYSALPVHHAHSAYYYGGSGDLPTLIHRNEETLWRGLLHLSVEKSGQSFTVAVTHFTRTNDGSASDKQREDMKNLLALLANIPDVILCGDFNAPRGGEIFGILADKYTDNIPPHYTSSLDPNLHRLRNSKQLMVDGLFTTPEYRVSEAKLTEGVSDHKAVTAVIAKN